MSAGFHRRPSLKIGGLLPCHSEGNKVEEFQRGSEMEKSKDKFADLLEDSSRSKRIKKLGTMLFGVAILAILIGLLFGALPGIGFAIVFSYAVNRIVERPKRIRK
jgi:hypothetical protein